MKKLSCICTTLCLLVLFCAPVQAETLEGYQKQLKKLYIELIELRTTEDFAQMGFGPGHKKGNAWMKATRALKAAMEKDKMPFELTDGVDTLANLGLDFYSARSRGFHNVMGLSLYEEATYIARKNIEYAIDYKPATDTPEEKGRIIDITP